MRSLEDDFELVSRFRTHPDIVVWRGWRRSDRLPVVLKSPSVGAKAAAGDEEVVRLRYEHGMLHMLAARTQANCLVQPVQLWGQNENIALVLHDIGGVCLDETLAQGLPEIPEAVRLARRTLAALDVVHTAGVLHKDINPRNLVHNRDTDHLQIIDFGIAVPFAREVHSTAGRQAIEGTLAYAPPEQIGRMNRHADARSDYYSLGATLYHLVCGVPPFAQDNPSQLMHAILTTPPVAPHIRNPRVSEALSAVIMKLLEKAQEQRYQSIQGIDADLLRCEAESAPFALGAQDRNEQFDLPQRLYGRELELHDLHAALREAARGQHRIVFLGGPSGIGKSALVGELQGDLTQYDAHFAAGKHDQLHRHIPFSALAQAVGALVRGILVEPEHEVAIWRRRIQGALGSLGQALVELVPALELLIGKQPPVVPLATQETHNRLHMLWQRLINEFAQRNALVLFLDDLQWADLGTIRFLEDFTNNQGTVAGVCIIAAFRNDEVANDAPLGQLMRRSTYPAVMLAPLQVDATSDLVRDATHQSASDAAKLAHVVHDKTAGNPYFAREYLSHLHRQGLLTYDAASRSWNADLPTIGRMAVSDNVVALLSSKLRALPAEVQRQLSIAACLGNEFHLRDVQQVGHFDRGSLSDGMLLAVADKLLLPLGTAYRYAAHSQDEVTFKFAHDRIQQAAFALLPPDEALQVSYACGMYLHQQWQANPANVSIFTVLEHLNASSSLRTERAAQLELAHLDLLGGREAKKAGSNAFALEYLHHAWGLLGATAWQDEPELARALQIEMADNELLSERIAEASARFDLVIAHTPDVLARADVESRRVYALTAANEFDQALDAGVHALAMVGVRLPRHPSKLQVLVSAARTLLTLARNDMNAFPDRPSEQSRQAHLAFELLANMTMPAFYRSHNLWTMISMVVAREALAHGTTPLSGYCIGILAVVQSQFNRYRQAQYLITIMNRLVDKIPNSQYLAGIEFCRATWINFLTLDMHGLIEAYRGAYETALRTGDPLFGGWSAVYCVLTTLWNSLSRSDQEMQTYESFVNRRNETHQVFTLQEVHRLRRLMLGECELSAYMNDGVKAEAARRRSSSASYFAVFRTSAYWLLGQTEAAWEAVLAGNSADLFEICGEQMVPVYCFYGALCYVDRRVQGLPSSPTDRVVFARIRAKLRALSQAAQLTYAGLAPLIDAALAASQGKHARAMAQFETALRAFDTSDLIVLRASAYEVVGAYYLRQGVPLAAQGYLYKAIELYGLWGATAKVAHMRQTYKASRLLGSEGSSTRGSSTGRSASHLAAQLDLSALESISQALVAGLPQEALARVALDALSEIASATRAILRVDNERGPSPVYDTAADAALRPDQIITYVQRTGETLIINDGQIPEALARDPYLLAARPPAVYCAPATYQGKVLAVVYLENTLAGGIFAAARQQMLALVVPQIAVALENRAFHSHLEALAESQANQLAEASRRLVQLEKETTENQMAGGFAHEVRNAVTAVLYTMPMLVRIDSDPADAAEQPIYDSNNAALTVLESTVSDAAPRQAVEALRENNTSMREMLLSLANGMQRALSITQTILDYAQASKIVPGGDRVDLAALVNDIVGNQTGTNREKPSIEVHIAPDTECYIAADHARTIIAALLSNAVQATQARPGAPQRIVVSADLNPDRVQLRIQDFGTGIPLENQRRVFDPFFTTKGARGMGLGLSLCRKLAAAYGGDVTFTTTPGAGSTFVVDIPTPIYRAVSLSGKPS